jgi:hypothetical protein
MLNPTCSILFHSFWWFLPQLEGPTTALPSGSRDPESQARTHRVARESRSWTRLGMALVVRRAPHLDEEICHTPLGSIGQRRKSMKINENQVSRWIKGQTQVTSFRFEEMNKIEQAMPHHLLVLLFISFLFSFFSGINHWSVDQQFFPSIIIGPLINCSSIENLIVHLLVRWKHHLLCVFPFF